jgi:hypothetical protein
VTGLLLTWVGLLVFLLVWVIGKRGEGGVLTLSYFLGMSLIHVPGLLGFLDPKSAIVEGRDITELGFEMTLLGMAAFVLSSFVMKQMVRPFAPNPSGFSRESGVSQSFWKLGWIVCILGICCYFTLLRLSFYIPSATSIVAAYSTLIIVGLWLALFASLVSRNLVRISGVLLTLPFLPMATLATGGFVGFGVTWALSVMSFLYVMAKRRIYFYLFSPLVIFLMLSVFVTYMGQRTDLRDIIWKQEADLFTSLKKITDIFTEFEVLDLARFSHIKALNERLNQNYFVGLAIEHLRLGEATFANGATVSPLALIPRVLWPEKPLIGGGGTLVADFTGLDLDPGSSFGAGQVLEFYINFGILGVIGGFLIFGAVLMRLDFRLMQALTAGNYRSVVTLGMTSLPLVQPGGNLLEIMVSTVAGYLAAKIMFLFLDTILNLEGMPNAHKSSNG